VRITLSYALLASAAICAHAADDVPEWVREAAKAAHPSYPPKVHSVTLVHEESVTVEPDGRRVMRERVATKVLQPGGEPLEAYRTYNTKSGRIRDFQGWLIPPAGKTVALPKNRVIDVELQAKWDEERAKVLEAGTIPPGSVFAWEAVEEEKTIFTQYFYRFQGRAPVLASRFSVTLPPGWEVRGTILNHANIDPQVNGSTYVWEMRDLPWIEPEDYSPTLAALVPRLMVSYFPPQDNRMGLEGLKDWRGVSGWLSRLMDPPAEVTPAIQAKAAELTTGAAGVLDKIRRIARFTQALTYVSVDMNVTRGGGYTPHRAGDTLTRLYGDCKDKATLMRALLAAQGIEAYAIVIYSSDRTYVRREWASPSQFNHAIVGIRVPDDVALPSVLPETPVGRLLIFDPTDPATPVGDLPQDEQGSFALLIAADRGALLAMPQLPADANRIESAVDAVVDAAGHIDARYQREYYGQSGAGLRQMQKLDGQDQIRKLFERGLSRRLSGLSLKQVEIDPARHEDRLSVNLNVSAERFAQILQDRMMVLRPGLLTSGGDYGLANRKRSAPIRLEADVRRESIRIKLPPGFKFDELPAASKVDSPYGVLQAEWTVGDGEVVLTERLEIRETVAPPSEYEQVRAFFDRVSSAQSAPVVLVKSPK
jgi:transglutaminase-like putative cysteine protease